MRTRKLLRSIGAVITVALFLAAWCVPAVAATPRVYVMKGKITAVDVPDHTVVINVPLGKKEVFTVAGPLAPDATLKKGAEKDVTLKDFHKGEWVTVKWRHTDSGHLILSLAGK